MARRPKKLPPKRERDERASLGRSKAALAALQRPGGVMGRRKRPRRPERTTAIQESANE